MFDSLRSRLILSYIVVISLTLCVAGAGLVLLLQGYQRGIMKQNLCDALGPASDQAGALAALHTPPEEIANQVQDRVEKNWRVLVIDNQGVIVADSQNGFVGRKIQRVGGADRTGSRRCFTGEQRLIGRDLVYAAEPIGRSASPQYDLVLASVLLPFVGGFEEVIGPFLTAGAIALLISVIIGLLLARSISEPLGSLTRASEAIARGKYDEQIPVEGKDEIARLASSFNVMVRAVKQSQETQKDFVANVSHELKTPLTSIQGFAQAIAEGATHDLDSARHAATLIFEEAQRMAQLVGDLLTLARLDSGETDTDRSELDLAAALPGWVARFQSSASSAGVALDLSVDTPPHLLANASRLEQVVANLVENGIKYNHPGGRVIVQAVSARPGEPPNRGSPTRESDHGDEWAVIRVSDTGAGIPKKSLPRVFERFYRGDRARVAGGSGLGLSIVREIVNAHHGKIEVKSEPGVGTTFTVWLPPKPHGS